MRCPPVSSALTGRNVPAPTCSVTPCRLDAARAQALQQRVGEMQARRSARRPRLPRARTWSGSRRDPARRAPRLRGDIGRQRHVAALGDRLVEHRAVKRERQRHLAAVALVLDRGVELAEQADLALVAEAQHVAARKPLRRPHERPPARAVEPLVQRRLDLRLAGAASDAPAGQARRRSPWCR